MTTLKCEWKEGEGEFSCYLLTQHLSCTLQMQKWNNESRRNSCSKIHKRWTQKDMKRNYPAIYIINNNHTPLHPLCRNCCCQCDSEIRMMNVQRFTWYESMVMRQKGIILSAQGVAALSGVCDLYTSSTTSSLPDLDGLNIHPPCCMGRCAPFQQEFELNSF